MVARKEYHCSVGCEVFCGVFNVLGEGKAGVARIRTWCVGTGCNIEGGRSGGEWKEEKDEDDSSLDSSHFQAALLRISKSK